MTTTTEVTVFKANGDLNADEWIDYHVCYLGMTKTEAIKAFNVAVVLHKEPPLLNSKGLVTNKWINWYRVRKRVSRSTASLVARNIVKDKVTDYDRAPRFYP